MNSKNLWIKKYSQIKNSGHLYLIADFKKMSEGPHIVVHEIVVDYKTLEDHSFEHKAYKYNVEKHLAHELPLARIVNSIFERHESAFTSDIESGNGVLLKEIDNGEKALYDLQFTEIFLDLKVQILKEPRSDTFSNVLNNMAHLPLRMERREQAVKSSRIAGLVGG